MTTPTDPKPYSWLKDWRVLLAFFGITGFGTLITKLQWAVGALAAPTIQRADSLNRIANREMISSFTEVILSEQKKGNIAVMASLGEVKDVVSRMQGAKAASDRLRREKEDRKRREAIFGFAEIKERQ
jgi:sensor histidine kinase regulating citrate/malate metabolism